MFIDIEESHAGRIGLPFLGEVPFAVELENQNRDSAVFGLQRRLADTIDLNFEFSNSARKSTLLNLTWRFGE